MGSRFTIPGFGLVALAMMLFWAAGCSNDSSLSTSLTPGLENDNGFLIVQEQVNNYLDSVDVINSMALAKIYKDPAGGKTPEQKPLDELSEPNINTGKIGTPVYLEGFSDGWHWTEYDRYFDTYSYSQFDSVKFMNDNLYLFLAVDLDYMRYIRHWQFVHDATTETHTDLSGYFDIEFHGLETNNAYINGFNNFLVESHIAAVDTTIDAVFGFETTISDLEVLRGTDNMWADGCPCSGVINMDVNVSYTVTTNSFPVLTARNWDISANISNGVATVSAISNQQYWTYTYNMCSTQ